MDKSIRNQREPLYLQISGNLRKQIATGVLKSGERLAPIRRMAEEMCVSKNTIEQAYGQLVCEGYLSNKAGSGYYVNEIQLPFPVPKIVGEETISVEEENCIYDLKYGKISPEDFSIAKWKKSLDYALQFGLPNQFSAYGNFSGNASFKTVLSEYLMRSRNAVCSQDQIVIAGSNQDLLEMIDVFFENHYKRKEIALENPGYDTIYRVMKNHKVKISLIPVTETGIEIPALKKSKSQLVYITPSHQFPTGAVMPIQKRLELLKWAEEVDGYIIEDDYDSEFRYASMPLPCLQGLDGSERVIYFGTFSKAFSPGIRLSYMVLPRKFIEPFNILFKGYHCTVSEFDQAALTHFMNSGAWGSSLRKVSAANKQRYYRLVKEIREQLGDAFSIIGGGAGGHIILQSNEGRSEYELEALAKTVSVRVYPAAPYYYGTLKETHRLVLGYTSLSPNEISRALKLLKKAWNYSKKI